jgi:hypothetical protein
VQAYADFALTKYYDHVRSALNTVLHAAEWLEEISQETELAARRGVQNESVEVQA